jgi:hypothetical protein
MDEIWVFVGNVNTFSWKFNWPLGHAFVKEQEAHNQPVIVKEYLTEITRDTLENWQSEFLQLIWQVAGLAYLFYIGSPQSKEGDDRKEEKLDKILMAVDSKNAEKIIKDLDKKYARD